MRTTQSFQFYCRSSKTNKQGLAPLELSICINQKRVFINLPMKFVPEEFNAKKQSPVIKQTVIEWRRKIDEVMVDMMQNGIPLTADHIREYIRTGGVKTYTIETLFDEYLSILKQRVGSSLTKGVYRKYEWVRDLFKEHIDFNGECTTITNAVIKSFYAKLDAKYDKSTSAGYMTKLKSVIVYGMDNGRLQINPFQGIKINKGKKDITYLTEEEIGVLLNARMDNMSLQRVLDCAVVMCGTGLAYCDLKDLNADDIRESDGVYYIAKKRRKTNEDYTAVIMPWAVDVLKKYDFNLPVISNQKLNCYLHTIEDLLGFKKSLHCHLFRRSYACMLLQNGVRLETVSKALGHSNTKITQQAYATLNVSNVLKEISSIF